MQLDIFDHGTHYPHAPGSHTSWKAAQRIKPRRRGVVTALYLNLLYRKGPLSDEEAHVLLNQVFKVARSSLSSIRATCMETLLVRNSGIERKALSGTDVACWELTPAGRAAQEAIR